MWRKGLNVLFFFLQDLDVIFSNILDIYKFTANLLSSLEEQVEVAAENEKPTVGICFQDLAEVGFYYRTSLKIQTTRYFNRWRAFHNYSCL